MVKIIDAQTRVNSKTKMEYNVIVLLGDVQVLSSKSSGKFYLSAKRVTLPTTLDQNQAKELIGTTLPGVIEKVDCPEYEIKMPNSNKKVKITHTFQYSPTVADEVKK
jgi:proteasome assembly chaperone (PAC2) family protein